MGKQITCHEEVRDAALGRLSGCASARGIAHELAISPSTARRYLEDMVQRGWAERVRTLTRNCKGRYTPHVYYYVSAGAKDSEW